MIPISHQLEATWMAISRSLEEETMACSFSRILSVRIKGSVDARRQRGIDFWHHHAEGRKPDAKTACRMNSFPWNAQKWKIDGVGESRFVRSGMLFLDELIFWYVNFIAARLLKNALGLAKEFGDESERPLISLECHLIGDVASTVYNQALRKLDESFEHFPPFVGGSFPDRSVSSCPRNDFKFLKFHVLRVSWVLGHGRWGQCRRLIHPRPCRRSLFGVSQARVHASSCSVEEKIHLEQENLEEGWGVRTSWWEG